MIRSTRHSLKFANAKKRTQIERLRIAYKQMLQAYLVMMKQGKMPYDKLLSSKILPEVGEITSAAWKQVASKQAGVLFEITLNKVKDQAFYRYKKHYAKCIAENKFAAFTSKRFSELKINWLKRVRIDIKNVSIDIDARLFNIEESSSFDEFIMLRLPWMQKGRKLTETIKIPIKYHKHSLKFSRWKRRKSIKLLFKNNRAFISLAWEKEDKPCNQTTFVKPLAIDIGAKKLLACSNGELYGQELELLYKKIAAKKRGSKSYQRSLTHRDRLTNHIINEFKKDNDFDVLFIEDLKSVKHKSKLHRKTNNFLQYWRYPLVLAKLKNLSQEEGFLLVPVNPAYTSQCCSQCGTIDKANRSGEQYRCSCGMEMDADLNAAKNILHRGVYNLSSKKAVDLFVHSAYFKSN